MKYNLNIMKQRSPLQKIKEDWKPRTQEWKIKKKNKKTQRNLNWEAKKIEKHKGAQNKRQEILRNKNEHSQKQQEDNGNDREWGNIESQPPIISFGHEISTMFDYCCLGPINQLLISTTTSNVMFNCFV